MIMIVHAAINMDDCFISINGCLQIGKKPLSVIVVPEYVLSLIAPSG
jgi:hypothetical protein